MTEENPKYTLPSIQEGAQAIRNIHTLTRPLEALLKVDGTSSRFTSILAAISEADPPKNNDHGGLVAKLEYAQLAACEGKAAGSFSGYDSEMGMWEGESTLHGHPKGSGVLTIQTRYGVTRVFRGKIDPFPRKELGIAGMGVMTQGNEAEAIWWLAFMGNIVDNDENKKRLGYRVRMNTRTDRRNGLWTCSLEAIDTEERAQLVWHWEDRDGKIVPFPSETSTIWGRHDSVTRPSLPERTYMIAQNLIRGDTKLTTHTFDNNGNPISYPQ